METVSLNMVKHMQVKVKEKQIKQIPGLVYVTNGSFSGEINLQWDAIKGAHNYIIQISKNGTHWEQVDIVSDPQYSLQGLKPGKKYSFRIAPVFTSGRGKWSDSVMKTIT